MMTFAIERGGVGLTRDEPVASPAWRPPVGTKVVELLPIEDRVIVREDYYHFPRDRSNVYCLDASLEAVWFAERPSGNDVYSGILGLAEGRLRLYSYDGFTCQVDPGTGRLLEARFTK